MTVNATGKPQRKVAKYSAIALLVVIAGLLLSQVIWLYSGSNQWELEMDQNGLKIYSMKSPGSAMKKFKSEMKVKAKLSAIVKLMEDPDVCDEIGCRDSKVLETVNEQLRYHSFVMDPPFPFRSREFVAKVEFLQDPDSKELLINFIAAPDKVPPSDCCYRVTHMNNTWRFKPLENGELQVEYIVDTDEGGAIPSILLNALRPQFLRDALGKLEGLMKREKYQNAEYSFLKS